MFENLKNRVREWVLQDAFGLPASAVKRFVRLGKVYDDMAEQMPVFGAAKTLANSFVQDDPMNIPKPDADEDQWQAYGLNSFYSKINSDSYREALVEWARYACRVYPHGGSVRTIANFVIGKGVDFDFPENSERLQKIWNAWEDETKFRRRQKEIFKRLLTDGECFIRWFIRKDGVQDFRFIDPLWIKTPTITNADIDGGKCFSGVVVNPEDYADIYGYWICRDEYSAEFVPSSDMSVIKLGLETDVRGFTILESVLPSIQGYRDWLNDRRSVQKTQSFFAIHKKISNASPSQVADLRGFPTTEYGTTDSRRYRATTIKSGSVITTSDNVELDLMTPNSYARDAEADGRAILLTIAAGLGIAEYMVTGDASNNNRASMEISETPSVRNFEDWQTMLSEFFLDIVKRVLSVDFVHDVTVTWPALIARNITDEIASSSFLLDKGIASKDTIATKFGVDYDAELEKMKVEANDGNPHEVSKADESPKDKADDNNNSK